MAVSAHLRKSRVPPDDGGRGALCVAGQGHVARRTRQTAGLREFPQRPVGSRPGTGARHSEERDDRRGHPARRAPLRSLSLRFHGPRRRLGRRSHYCGTGRGSYHIRGRGFHRAPCRTSPFAARRGCDRSSARGCRAPGTGRRPGRCETGGPGFQSDDRPGFAHAGKSASAPVGCRPRLRTPITALRINSEFIEDAGCASAYKKNLEELQELTEASCPRPEEPRRRKSARSILRPWWKVLCTDMDEMGEPVSWSAHAAPLSTAAQMRSGARPQSYSERRGLWKPGGLFCMKTAPDHYEIVIEGQRAGPSPMRIATRVFEPFVRLEAVTAAGDRWLRPCLSSSRRSPKVMAVALRSKPRGTRVASPAEFASRRRWRPDRNRVKRAADRSRNCAPIQGIWSMMCSRLSDRAVVRP